MNKVAIIHFNPIELYPPVMNLLNFIASQQDQNLQVRVFTMHADSSQKLFETNSLLVKICRLGQFRKDSASQAYSSYFSFYAGAIAEILSWRPGAILYYETLSSLPAYFYKRILHSKCKLFIHYHEYVSPGEYENGGILSHWLHRQEKKLYSVAEWVSQTNADRMRLFLQDNNLATADNQHIMPNYPPASWILKREKKPAMSSLKIIYTGALSMDTMYLKEFAEWVLKQPDHVTFHIYSSNTNLETKAYLQSLDNQRIKYFEAVDYFLLPEILANYDVGVILYKGHIPNYVYNAPNKLFEYFACGLDVWFPENMKTALSYLTTGTFPQIKAFNFSQLDDIDFPAAVKTDGLRYQSSGFFCEDVYLNLFDRITN
ncbi:MAG: hypothetical protein JST75_01070 [Bacteroidetes bacterium]|nr:hypothetical protein [Bacteroidota bacterium]